jgi:hypothetical protein
VRAIATEVAAPLRGAGSEVPTAGLPLDDSSASAPPPPQTQPVAGWQRAPAWGERADAVHYAPVTAAAAAAAAAAGTGEVSGSRRAAGSRSVDEAMATLYRRPLLVRFMNYNPHHKLRHPYGGLIARKWFGMHGYVETTGNDWDVLWCGKGQYQFWPAGLPRPWQ